MIPAAYYNEIDPYAAEWLRNLIAAGHIAPGDVDERNILDVRADDLAGYTQCHFFAGIGGWSYALRLAGWPDDRPVWTGSCPCQPFSVAGAGAGTADPRHLWPVWYSLIAECRPAVLFGEQVDAAIRHGWLDLVQGDLEGIGYAVGAAGIPAASVGAPHIRQRLWFVAEQLGDTSQPRLPVRECVAVLGAGRRGEGGAVEQPGRASGSLARPADGGRVGRGPSEACNGQHAARMQPERLCDAGRPGQDHSFWSAADWIHCRDGKWRPVEPGIFPLVNGLPGGGVAVGSAVAYAPPEDASHIFSRVGVLRGAGNAIVPQVAAAFVEAYLESKALESICE